MRSWIILAVTALIASSSASSSVIKIRNWGLFNVEAPRAWLLQESNPNVVVAIVDTGIDANHPDLAPNLWHDPKNPAIYGWDTISNKPNPSDYHGHGTHIAGIIAGLFNLAYGTSGVAPHVTIMPIRYWASYLTGKQTVSNSAKAINYAVDHGASIINYSSAGPDFDEDELMAFRRAESAGILVVCAAGNEGQNEDLVANYYYPAAYRLSNMITVASIDAGNVLLDSSNWGVHMVDIAAPGGNILSTIPGGRYGYMGGTSQATAFVTGAAALLLSKNLSLTPVQLKKILTRSASPVKSLSGKVASGGHLNIRDALLRAADF